MDPKDYLPGIIGIVGTLLGSGLTLLAEKFRERRAETREASRHALERKERLEDEAQATQRRVLALLQETCVEMQRVAWAISEARTAKQEGREIASGDVITKYHELLRTMDVQAQRVADKDLREFIIGTQRHFVGVTLAIDRYDLSSTLNAALKALIDLNVRLGAALRKMDGFD